jgi:hypothetical protein
MDAIDAQESKVTKMRAYIANCRTVLSATEDAEFAKRLRQYWSASTKKQDYFEKLEELEEETRKVLKARAKANNVFFVVAILVVLAIHYLNLVDNSNKIILGVGLAAYFVIKELAHELEANKNAIKTEGWKAQVNFYTHEMSCSGGGYVAYEDEYLKAQNDDDIEPKKALRELYLLSVEIAILQGLKSTLQRVDF